MPDDVAIVCFDDSDAAPLLDPPLTVLARRDREIGDLAASMVLRALEHAAAGPMDVRISMELEIRRSCGCPATAGTAWSSARPRGRSTARPIAAEEEPVPADHIRVASAPVSFGVDEIMIDDAWMPAPDDMLDWMVEIGFEGTELGPPGFMGERPQVRERLSSRDLELVGAFLPQHFSRDEKAEEDRAWLRDSLRLVRDGAPDGSQPLAILSDQFDEPDRLAFSGRIAGAPRDVAARRPASTRSSTTSTARPSSAAAKGFESVLHPHAGTYVETADEIARVMDRIDPSLIGLCLDTGHFRFGGADPARSVDDYHELDPPRPHQGLPDVGDGRREGRGQGPRGGPQAGRVLPARRWATRASTRSSRRSARHDYSGWLVIEQDQALGPSDTPESVVAVQRANREYLRRFGI